MLFSHGLFKPTYIIPTGLIIPYTGGAGGIPSGWAAYTTADDYTIIGAGSTYAIDDFAAGTGNFIANTSTNGTHFGASSISTTATDGNKWRNYTSSGNHSHSFTINYEPPWQRCYLMKAGADQIEFPTTSVLFTYGVDKSSVSTNIWTTADRLFMGDSSLTAGGTNTHNAAVSDSQGSHGHGNTDSGDGSGSWAAITQGGDTHTENITMVPALRVQAMAAWSNAASTVSLNKYGSNIIGMYESLTPPDGWHLCNGSNNTPDMRDYFVKNTAQASAGSGSGDGTVTATTPGTVTHGTHQHGDNNEDGGGGGTSWHNDLITMPAHSTLNSSDTWLPDYYALAFIMKG
jgi:hypothetical protein